MSLTWYKTPPESVGFLFSIVIYFDVNCENLFEINKNEGKNLARISAIKKCPSAANSQELHSHRTVCRGLQTCARECRAVQKVKFLIFSIIRHLAPTWVSQLIADFYDSRAASECEPLLRALGQSHSDCQLATDGNDNFEAAFSHSGDEPERIWMWTWNGVKCTMIFYFINPVFSYHLAQLKCGVLCWIYVMLPSTTINLDVRVKIVRLVRVSDEWKLCYRLHVSWESSERCYLVWSFFYDASLLILCI